jgi:hypothetical protein
MEILTPAQVAERLQVKPSWSTNRPEGEQMALIRFPISRLVARLILALRLGKTD